MPTALGNRTNWQV